MKTLYYNLIATGSPLNKFIRSCFQKKMEFPTEAEIDEIESSPDFQELWNAIEASEVKRHEIPHICPENTALFITLDPDKSRINYLNEFFYRRKVRSDFRLLREQDYTTFIVNSGTQYGMLAMEELLKIKNYGKDFRIYCALIKKEKRSLLHNFLHQALMEGKCDERFEIYQPAEYARSVVQRVTAISTEKNILLTENKIPTELRNYYLRFIKMLKIDMLFDSAVDAHLFGDNRTIYSALCSLPGKAGTLEDILSACPKLKRPQAQSALNNLVMFEIAKLTEDTGKYEIIA